MQERELRLEMLELLDDIETSITKQEYELVLEDIKEYRQYLQNTTIIKDVKKSSENVEEDTRL